ncbi:MAG: mercuric reductase [Bryobacteraceae bacterium]
MTHHTKYDVLIIGGGQAGIPLAHGLAKQGKRVALAESKHLGGSCVNFGCTPTKAAIASAKVAHLARRGTDYGLRIPAVEVYFPKVLERARSIAKESRDGLDKSFEESDNPKLLRGEARIEEKNGEGFQVTVGEHSVQTRELVVNTGTCTNVPRVEGLAEIEYLDSENWLDRPELPARLAILGGGYIALEMAQFYRRMGSEVTVIERSGQILSHEDEDVARSIQELVEREGVRFHLNSEVKSVRKDGGQLVLDRDGGQMRVSNLFVATGRKPNTGDLGLEKIGVKLSKEGTLEADRRLATNVEGVWAAGDVRGGPMFTHTSWDDYRILMSQMTGDGSRTTDRIVPYAVFTDPELGRVGMTEKEARKTGRDLKISRFDMKKNGKAREIGAPDGFIKLIADAREGKLLGAAVLADQGGELVHIYVDLMNANAPYSVIRDAVHIHPTLAEAIQSAASALE